MSGCRGMPCPCSNIGVIPPGGTDSEVYTGNLRRLIETETPVIRGPQEPVCSCAVTPSPSRNVTPAESAYLVTKVQQAPSRVYNTAASCGSLPAPIPNGGCTPVPANTPGNQNYRILPRETRIDRYALPARIQPGSTITARIRAAAAAANPFPVYVIPPVVFNNCALPAPSSGGVPKASSFCLTIPNAVDRINPRH